MQEQEQRRVDVVESSRQRTGLGGHLLFEWQHNLGHPAAEEEAGKSNMLHQCNPTTEN